MNTKQIQRTAGLAVLTAAALTLTACGGGGGGGDNSNTSPGIPSIPSTPTTDPTTTVPAGTTQATPTYAAAGVQSTILTTLNSYRAQCGFPAMSQNTILDAAATAHTDYMVANNFQVTDTEVAGNAGFTGVTANDRAIAKGWPTGLPAATQNAGAIAPVTTDAEYGALIANTWSTGVYHQTAVTYLANLVGVGTSTGTNAGYKTVLAGLVFSSDTSGSNKIATSKVPATFPCQGVTGIPYYGAGESPMPPSYETVHTVSGDILRWGTPVTVEANTGDLVTVTTATYTAPDSTVIQLNLVTSANDPAQLTPPNRVVAYPTNALQPSTTYTVDLAGTVNGTAFTKHFTFTTSS
jgi:hypothetical protein